MRRAGFRLAAALLLLALLGVALTRLVPLRAEMTDLLPPGGSPAAEFLLEELRSGAATTLLLAGIEGAPEPELARISLAMGQRLRDSGLFAFIGNGTLDLSPEEEARIFRYRYLLGEADFAPETLRKGLTGLLEMLRSAISPVMARYGFADPTLHFFRLLQGWLGQSQVQQRHGAWFAGDAQPARALLVARSRASGLDTEAQAAAVAAIQAAFAAARPGPARLLLSGPGVFGAEAARAIRADVELISLCSGLLVLGFILVRYRSALVLLAVAVPLLAGSLAGLAAVGLVFGAVHGAAFGFGMTMLGVVVDYPLLLLAGRRAGEAPAAAARRLRPVLGLAAGTAALGLTGMLASGFPILAQLGLFGAAGLLAGLAATLLLPWLLGGAVPEPRPLPAPLARALAGLRGRRVALLLPALALLALILAPPRWEEDLARLSPVPAAQLRLDEELRAQLGAPDVQGLIAVSGPDAETVLQRAEAVERALAPLQAAGTLRGLESPVRFLPSAATQRARQAALPQPEAIRPALLAAAQGLPFRPEAFAPFLAALSESRALPVLGVADLAELPLLAARLGPLLGPLPQPRQGWQGLVIPQGLRDPAALRQALAGLPPEGLLWVEIKAEMAAIIDAATLRALLWCGLGGLAVLLLLALALPAPAPTPAMAARPAARQFLARPLAALRVALPILAALLATLAALSLLDQRLTPFHLAALLLAAGVAIDYALVFGTLAGQSPDDANRTLAAVFNCTMTTLLTFGLLAFCQTPILRGIGLTVALGASAGFLLALMLAPRAAPEPA